jgi:hypothetical protein
MYINLFTVTGREKIRQEPSQILINPRVNVLRTIRNYDYVSEVIIKIHKYYYSILN